MEFQDFTQEDANMFGIGYAVSKYSKKVINENDIIGFIIFQDIQIHISNNFIEKCNNEDARQYYKNLQKANSICLRTIKFRNEYRYRGIVEDLFDHITNTVIPTDYIIWCYTRCLSISYIKQIGGFNPPIYLLPQQNILLFSIDS